MSRNSLFTGALTLLFIITGCANQSKQGKIHKLSHKHSEEAIEDISSRSEKDFQGLEARFEEIEDSLEKEDLSLNSAADRPEHASSRAASVDGIKLEFNDHVKKWIRYFAVRSKARFQRHLDRGEKYRDVVEEVLRQHGLPPELYYLAMIESGYSNHARSPMAAVGAWQFIPGTGRRYGLGLNRYLDERRDPIRATEAASRYLTDLFNVFNSWYLAMAAYNAGEGRVLNAIMRGNTRDFWELVRMKKLPRETRSYVPKFMAAAIIGRNPERFGFRTPRAEPYPDVTAVELPSPISLKAIARESNISLNQLKKVNAHLLRGVTSPNKRTYDVWIPSKLVASVKKVRKSLVSHRIAKLSKLALNRRNPNYHRVKRGESLSSIASKYRISLSELKRANRLNGNRIIAGSRLRVASSGYQRSQGSKHRVRRGETLSSIARKYDMTITEIRSKNGLRSNRIYAGQQLSVRVSKQAKIHVVRRGESLFRIAKKYGQSVKRIMRLNQMTTKTIYPGTHLIVAQR